MILSLRQFAKQLLLPKKAGQEKYTTFKKLLNNDRLCHELLAELEELYYQKKNTDIQVITRLFAELSTAVAALVRSLQQLMPDRYDILADYHKKFDFYCRFSLAPPKINLSPPFTLPLQGLFKNDLQVGGKAFHLSQIHHELGLPVPEGFIITTSATNLFFEKNSLRTRIDEELAHLNIDSDSSLTATSQALTDLILSADLPGQLKKEIQSAAVDLQQRSPASSFAVRSSAVAEDSSISFAGQYHSELAVRSSTLLTAYKKVVASKYSPRALTYRIRHGLIDDEVPMAVLVLEMLVPLVSGVVTSQSPCDPAEKTLIHTVAGLGDNLVSGTVSPTTSRLHRHDDHWSVDQLPADLSTEQALQLGQWIDQAAAFYHAPKEMEWCLNQDNNLLILQCRALVMQEEDPAQIDLSAINLLPLLLQGGETASRGLACGPIYHLKSAAHLDDIPSNVILVCRHTPPSLARLLPRLAGVVAEQGSMADHFASVARETGVPELVKCNQACNRLNAGQEATLWADNQTLYGGTIDLPPARPGEPPPITPVQKAFTMAMKFISPLSLANPESPTFIATECRSFHDIIRFCHEKGVLAMFDQAASGLVRKGGSQQLRSAVPLALFVLNIGDGVAAAVRKSKVIELIHITSRPLLALWKGLTHPAINWSKHDHFNWKGFDDIALAGGLSLKNDTSFASYALISSDYLNLNLRFGYHFVLIDALCGPITKDNYIMLRFAGGGGELHGKNLRLLFISTILEELGYNSVTCTGDLLDARLTEVAELELIEILDMTGRLLGASKLLDMVLTDETMVVKMVEEFMAGRYDFSKDNN